MGVDRAQKRIRVVAFQRAEGLRGGRNRFVESEVENGFGPGVIGPVIIGLVGIGPGVVGPVGIGLPGGMVQRIRVRSGVEDRCRVRLGGGGSG